MIWQFSISLSYRQELILMWNRGGWTEEHTCSGALRKHLGHLSIDCSDKSILSEIHFHYLKWLTFNHLISSSMFCLILWNDFISDILNLQIQQKNITCLNPIYCEILVVIKYGYHWPYDLTNLSINVLLQTVYLSY